MSSTSQVRAGVLTTSRLLTGALLALTLSWALTMAYPRLVMHGAPAGVLDVVSAFTWLAGVGVPLLAIGAVIARLRR